MKTWYDRAQAVLPSAGFGNFDPEVIISHGQGAHIWDVEGRKYIDFLIGSGPMLLGHAHPEVTDAVIEQLSRGSTFFATNTQGIELAEIICAALPCADQLRYVSTGGEADMFAMRLARAFTGREKIVKFEGGYHGMSAEAQMSLKPSRLVNFPQSEPDSAGILPSVCEAVLVAPYNDELFISSLIAEQGEQIAAIIVEPLQRIIPPEPGFLDTLRRLCDAHGIVLIFDEVVTGFRLAWGGAQEKYGVVPDVCTLGKTIGGGFPLAAIAGRADIMALFDRSQAGARGVMQVGTLSGNPVAAIAGQKTLEILSRAGQYEKLRSRGRAVREAISQGLSVRGFAHRLVGDDTLFDVVFTDSDLRDYRDVKAANMELKSVFNSYLRAGGLLKSAEKIYPHLALTEDDISQTLDIVNKACQSL